MNNEHNENEKNIEKNTIQNWWKNVGLKPNLLSNKSWWKKLLGSLQKPNLQSWWKKIILNKKIIICFIFVLIIVLGMFGYEQYQIYDFQKRYKEAPVGSLVKTGNMIKPRSEHVNILLNDGKVLVVGGNRGAEIFNPKTGQYKLINDKIEKISFNVHNYFVLDNGNIIISNKYLFDVAKYKFIQLNQDNRLYNNLSLSGYSPAISNIFDLDKNNLIMAFLNQNQEIDINCYDKSLNEIKSCKIVSDLYKYLFPLNKVFYLEDGKYIILVSFDPSDYKNKYDSSKCLQNEVNTKLVLWDSKNDTFNTIKQPNISSYNIQTAIIDGNNIWIVDNNSNLYSISTENYNGTVKTNLFGNSYFTRLFRIDTDTLLLVCPVYIRPSVFKFIYFDTKKNEIVKIYEFQYKDIQSSDFRTRKSYDIVKLKNQDLLINGGQSGTYAPTTRTNESYIYKTIMEQE